MKVQILGTGCRRCKALIANAEIAVKELGLQTEVEKVSEIKDIMKFQILMTPGLVIDGKVKAAGRVRALGVHADRNENRGGGHRCR